MAFNKYAQIDSTQEKIFPAYEIVKLNILGCWIDIQDEYMKLKNNSLNGQDYPTHKLASIIITLYNTILRSMIRKLKSSEDNENFDPKTFITEFDKTVKTGITIKNIDGVVRQFADIIHYLGLTDIGYESESWEESFRKSFGD